MQKKTFLSPKYDKSVCNVHVEAVLSRGRKCVGLAYGQSLEALGQGLYGSIAKRSLQKQNKNYPKNDGQTGGGTSPLNTLLTIISAIQSMRDVYTRQPMSSWLSTW